MIQLPDILGLWHLPLGAEISLLFLEAFVLVTQGAKHGFFYAERAFWRAQLKDAGSTGTRLPVESERQWWVRNNLELHYVDRRLMWGMYALLIAAGCDVIRVFLVQSIARPVFQGLINWGAGRDFIDRREPKSYGEKKRGEWHQVKKRITGTGRVWWAGLAAVLLFYEPIIHQLMR